MKKLVKFDGKAGVCEGNEKLNVGNCGNYGSFIKLFMFVEEVFVVKVDGNICWKKGFGLEFEIDLKGFPFM